MKMNIPYFLKIYFTSLSISRAMNFRMARWDLSEELETIWNRWLLPGETQKNHDRGRLC
jgi:hypothetical protein